MVLLRCKNCGKIITRLEWEGFKYSDTYRCCKNMLLGSYLSGHTDPRETSAEMRRALYHLLWVWYQYDHASRKYEKTIYLEHRNMTAGERACGMLEEYGLVEDQGYGLHLTEKGMKLFESDID